MLVQKSQNVCVLVDVGACIFAGADAGVNAGEYEMLWVDVSVKSS